MHNYRSNQSAFMTRFGTDLRHSMEFSAVNRRRPSCETPLGSGAKKDGCFRRLRKHGIREIALAIYDRIFEIQPQNS